MTETPATDIGELARAAPAQAAWLAEVRAGIGTGIDWYPYEILGNLLHLDHLLHGDNRDLSRLARDLPVADIGGADGDLAFVLERAGGWKVDLIDTAATNMNYLRGGPRPP